MEEQASTMQEEEDVPGTAIVLHEVQNPCSLCSAARTGALNMQFARSIVV